MGRENKKCKKSLLLYQDTVKDLEIKKKWYTMWKTGFITTGESKGIAQSIKQ